MSILTLIFFAVGLTSTNAFIESGNISSSDVSTLLKLISNEQSMRRQLDIKLQKLEEQVQTLTNNSDDGTSRKTDDSVNGAKFRQLENQIKLLEENLNTVTSKPIRDNKQVAFSGTLSRQIPNSEFGQIVKFNVVTTNIGNAYDVATGIFQCPVSGLYLISTTVLGDKNSFVILETRQNGKLIARSHSGFGGIGHKSGTDTSVIHAKKGDTISSIVTSGSSAYLDHFSRFTAVLLKTD